MSSELEAAGAPVTAGLGATETEGPAPSTGAHSHGLRCANCGAALAGKFCSACGQPAHVHRSLLHLTEEVLHGILHFDAKGWRTLPLLVFRPGLLTRRYIEGQRARHVSPLALFLFSVFLMFFVFSMTADSPFKVDVGGAADAAPASPGGLAGADLRTGSERIDAALKQAQKNPELTLYKLKSSAYKYSFLLVPISLPFLWLMFFWRPGIVVYDHAVFLLYSLSFMSVLLIVVALLEPLQPSSAQTFLLLMVAPLHMFMQLLETYQLGFFSALWRTALLLVLCIGVLLSFLLLIVVLTTR